MAHTRMYDDSDPVIKKLRELCFSLGDVIEKEAWGECTFRAAGGSMFAMTDNNHHGSGHVAVWIKAPAMAQEVLVHSDPRRFFRPPYLGHKGWVGVRLVGKVNWKDVVAILKDGYQLSAPNSRRRGVMPGSGRSRPSGPPGKPGNKQAPAGKRKKQLPAPVRN